MLLLLLLFFFIIIILYVVIPYERKATTQPENNIKFTFFRKSHIYILCLFLLSIVTFKAKNKKTKQNKTTHEQQHKKAYKIKTEKKCEI